MRVDTIEQGLRDFYQTDIYNEGYQLAFRLAKDNLTLGLSVIGDSCNSITESRIAWQQIATDLGIQFVNIEVICSDESEHQVRVETRKTSIPNLTLPTWKQVQEREYQVWENEVLKVDTADQTIQQSVSDLFQLLKQTY